MKVHQDRWNEKYGATEFEAKRLLCEELHIMHFN